MLFLARPPADSLDTFTLSPCTVYVSAGTKALTSSAAALSRITCASADACKPLAVLAFPLFRLARLRGLTILQRPALAPLLLVLLVLAKASGLAGALGVARDGAVGARRVKARRAIELLVLDADLGLSSRRVPRGAPIAFIAPREVPVATGGTVPVVI